MMAAPGFWMRETGGELRPAVERLIRGEDLSLRDIALIRAYCCQWADATGWDRNPWASESDRMGLARLRELARVLINRESIEAWVQLAVDLGMDPL